MDSTSDSFQQYFYQKLIFKSMEIIFSGILHSKFSINVSTELTRSAAPNPAFEGRVKKRRSGSTLSPSA